MSARKGFIVLSHKSIDLTSMKMKHTFLSKKNRKNLTIFLQGACDHELVNR